jgi:hypothetical protein
MINSMKNIKVAWIALLALCFVAFLGKSYETTLRGIDSNIHAKVSLDVSSQGLKPNLPMPDPNAGYPEIKTGPSFNDHPFFYFWINGHLMRILGPSAWSARVLTATFSVGCVLLTFLLGTVLYSEFFGFLAAVFLLFTRDVILTGATVSLDPAMLFFILLSFYLWQKKNWVGVGIATGIGLWIKTPVVLLVYPTAFFVSILDGRIVSEVKKIWTSLFIALIVGSLVWMATGLLGNWKLVGDYWIRQLWGTAVGGRNLGQNLDYWMFFRLVKNGFIPGFPFLVLGLIQGMRKKNWKQPAFYISIIAILVLLAAITPLRFKMDYYFNPAFPFLSYLAAFSLVNLLKPYEARVYSVFTAFACLLLAFLICTPTSLGPEAFVALKRFIPYIQVHGDCDDPILLIPGGEPVGSTHDSSLVLNFYTGHPVDIKSCETVGSSLKKNQYSWIILSKENYQRCLTAEEKGFFPVQMKVGTQILLTDLISPSATIDLTPLELELKPSVDCKPPQFLKDRFHTYD